MLPVVVKPVIIFCDGAMLGMVTENVLYLRVDDENREAF
jgi:DNA transformation protein